MSNARVSADVDRIGAIDGLRAVSVALVIVCHLIGFSSIRPPQFENEVLELFRIVAASLGPLGVSIFFFISGFVICRGLVKETAQHGKVSVVAFYIRRFFRIVPPLFMYVAFIVATAKLGLIEAEPKNAVRMLSFTCNFIDADCGGWYGGHTWSLSAEEQFYLLIPILFLLFARFTKWGSLLGFVSIVIATLSLKAAGHEEWARFCSNFTCISLGVVCGAWEARVRAWTARMPTAVLWLNVIGMIVLLRLSNTRFWAEVWVVIAVTIAIFVLGAISDRRSFAWLNFPPLVQLGMASYGIYLWQQVATGPYEGAGPAFYCLTVGLCVAWALLSFQLMERRLVRVGRALGVRASGRA